MIFIVADFGRVFILAFATAVKPWLILLSNGLLSAENGRSGLQASQAVPAANSDAQVLLDRSAPVPNLNRFDNRLNRSASVSSRHGAGFVEHRIVKLFIG